MDNNKLLQDLIARVQKLEAQVDAFSKKEKAQPSVVVEGKKRCLPGFNECQI